MEAVRASGLICGVDEAGRGPLAGPVVAAGVVLCKPRPAGLDDSKKLSRERRGELEAAIKRRWHRKDWWIDSDEALKLGFVDEIR